jgi:Ca-activated chloride channel family protein
MLCRSAPQIILAIALGMLCPETAWSQEAPRVIRVDVGLVLVNVALFDSRQQPMIGYQKGDIELYEDGVRQEITYFGRDDLPLNIALVLDVSGSIIPILPEIKGAADRALDALRPVDAVALFAFARRVRRIVDYTTEHERVVQSISDLSAGGGTALVDALYSSALSLRQMPADRRRVIVMISDNQGMPVNRYTERQAIEEAQEAGAVVYAIQVKGERDPLRWAMPAGIFSRRIRDAIKKAGNMKRFAEATGGSLLSVEKLKGIENAFREFMRQMSSQYYIGYFSSNPKRDGTLRKIEIKLSKAGRSRLGNPKIQHRRAYIAPRSPSN